MVVAEPVDPPRIPPALLRLVNGRDQEWGRNGHAWIGVHQEKHGGTALQRAREYAVQYVAGWVRLAPVALTTEQAAALLEREQTAVSVPQDTVVVVPEPVPTVTGQLTMFGWL